MLVGEIIYFKTTVDKIPLERQLNQVLGGTHIFCQYLKLPPPGISSKKTKRILLQYYCNIKNVLKTYIFSQFPGQLNYLSDFTKKIIKSPNNRNKITTDMPALCEAK